MDANHILVTAAVGVVCFLAGLLAGRRRRDERMIVQPSPLAPVAAQQQPQQGQPGQPESGGAGGGVGVQLGRDVHELIAAGDKLGAIRLVREQTGMGLKESKDAVERLESLMKRLGG